MKILFITDLYPIKKNEKNTPKTLHNFVFEWIKQGHLVDVIKPNFIFNSFLRKKPFYKTGFYNYEGVKIFNVNYHTPFLFDISNKMPEGIDIAKYDVIIAHMPSGVLFADKLAHKYKIKLILGVHSSDFAILKNPLYKLYIRTRLIKAYKNSEKIACRSFVLLEKFNKEFPQMAEKTFVAPSGINFELSSLRHFDLNELKIITCANLIKRKNIDKLTSALNQLDGFKLKIIGDGPELVKLKKIASDRVEFLGRLENKNVLEEMKKSDIFILPSINETFGMVYLEAMASGCLVVCSKKDGIDGIIKDGVNGFLTEPTVEGIKETLLRIKSCNNLEEFVENSLETVKKYSQAECAKNYLKNIEATLSVF